MEDHVLQAIYSNKGGRYGVKINASRNEEMKPGVRNQTPLLLNIELVEHVHTYLWTVVSENGETVEDMTSRVDKARATFAELSMLYV